MTPRSVSTAWLVLGFSLACAPRTSPVEPQPQGPPPAPAPVGGVLAPDQVASDPAAAPPGPAIEPSPEVATTVSEADRKRIEAVRDREMAILTKDPRWEAYLKRSLLGVTDPQVAYDRGFVLGRTLTERGVGRLSAAHLDRWCQLRLRIAETSEQACAGLWTGVYPGDSHNAALARLSEDDLADLMRMNAEAGLAELGAKEPLASDPEALRLGLDAIAKTLSKAERARLDQVLTGQTTVAADHCFATKAIHARAAKLPQALRTRFLRAMAVSIAEPTG